MVAQYNCAFGYFGWIELTFFRATSGLPVIQPQSANLKSFTMHEECIGDLSSADNRYWMTWLLITNPGDHPRPVRMGGLLPSSA
jgi:hypothetical protein